ncbi:hypothetical protein C9374_013977 [Naegleria lovaniensis]|uniref:HTH araC/xylS-type domain-containing protein n=1 Tax=Naegleria lovaniensis TaxID=51637 RepID=A0AA88GYH3_NAELO|nr:uncharacterized protein C9374_013977 [Naegleria lovaniensis]KAG2389417.1 hypothetical protein C9374_013977 [Naegleria lovaniensis]
MKCVEFVDDDLLVIGSSEEAEQNQLYVFNLRNLEWCSYPLSGEGPPKSSFYYAVLSQERDRIYIFWSSVESGLYATLNQDFQDDEGFQVKKGQLVTIYENDDDQNDEIEYVYCITQERQVGEVPKSYFILEEENNFFDTFEHSVLQLSVLTFHDMQWRTIQFSGNDFPKARRDFSCNLIDNCIYLFAGVSDSAVIHNDVYVLNLSMYQVLTLVLLTFYLASYSWEKVKLQDHEKPPPRYGHSTTSLVVPSTFVVMFGGLDYEDYRNDLFLFDLSSKEWSEIEIESGPSARAFHSVINYDESTLLFFGGEGKNGLLNDICSLNISDSKWSEIKCSGDTPSRRIHSTLGLKEGELLCFGGIDNAGTTLDLFSLSFHTCNEQKNDREEKEIEKEQETAPVCELNSSPTVEDEQNNDGFVIDFDNYTFTIEETETPNTDATTQNHPDVIDIIFHTISNEQHTISINSLINLFRNCRIPQQGLMWETILEVIVRMIGKADLSEIEERDEINCRQFREITTEIAKMKFNSTDSSLERLIEEHLLPYHATKYQDTTVNEIYSLQCLTLFIQYSKLLQKRHKNYPELDYPQFLEALGRIAIFIFSKKPLIANKTEEQIALLFENIGFGKNSLFNSFFKKALSLNPSNVKYSKIDNKLKPVKPKEIKQQYLDLIQNKHELKAELHNIFMYYCSFGNRLNLNLMSSFKFRFFIRDTNIYTYGFKQETADLVFIKILSASSVKNHVNSQKMNFSQFIECLKELANKLRPDLSPSKAFAKFLLIDVLPNVNRLGSAQCDIDEEVATAAERVFETIRRNLQRLFILYCNSNSSTQFQSIQETMHFDEFFKLAADFDLVPFISKKDMYRIFKSCCTNDSNESLSYQKFEEALLKYAKTAFSKYPYDSKYPTIESKLGLLIEKMALTQWNLLRKKLEKLGRTLVVNPSLSHSPTKPVPKQ